MASRKSPSTGSEKSGNSVRSKRDQKPAPAPMAFEFIAERNALQHPVELELWSNKNSIDGEIPIYGNITIGPILIGAGGKHYRMLIRSVTLQLAYRGFDVTPQTRRYRRVIDKKEAKAHVERVMREETKSSWTAQVGAHFGVSHLSASGGVSGGRKNDAKRTQKIEANIDLPLVQNLPGLSWRIGDEKLGDIRKMQGFLEGDYLYHDCPEKEPLCQLSAHEQAGVRSITGTLMVSMKRAAHIVPEDGYASDPGIPQSERDGEFAQAFKDYLRSLALWTGMEGRDQFVIARHTLKATPVVDKL